MTTTETTTEAPVPVLPLPQRLAEDLRALADIAEANPALAAELHYTLRELHVVLPRAADVTCEQVVAAFTGGGGRELPQVLVDPCWASRAVVLAAAAVKVTVTQLSGGES